MWPFFPSLNIGHTNAKLKGQVCILALNWLFCCVVVVWVVVFESSSALTALYGMAISVLYFLKPVTIFSYVALLCWGLHLNACVVLIVIFLVDMTLFCAIQLFWTKFQLEVGLLLLWMY